MSRLVIFVLFGVLAIFIVAPKEEQQRPLSIEEQEFCLRVAQDQINLNPMSFRMDIAMMNRRLNAGLRRSFGPNHRKVDIYSASFQEKRGNQYIELDCGAKNAPRLKIEYRVRPHEDPLFPMEAEVIGEDGDWELCVTHISVSHILYNEWVQIGYPADYKPSRAVLKRLKAAKSGSARILVTKTFSSTTAKAFVVKSSVTDEYAEYDLKKIIEEWKLVKVTFHSHGKTRSIVPYSH